MDHGAHNRYGDLRTIYPIPPSSYDSYQVQSRRGNSWRRMKVRQWPGQRDSEYGDLRT